MSGLIRYGDIALPLSYEVINKGLHFCDVKTKKEKRQSSTTKNQLFRAMIKQAIINQVLFDYVFADNWFGAKDNMEFVNYEMKKFFLFGIKANFLVAFSNEERKKGQYHNLKSLNLKDGEKRIIRLKDLAFPVAFQSINPFSTFSFIKPAAIK